jgi:beta-mannosidase
VSPGDHLHLDVHVVNDLRTAVEPAVVDVVATWAGGRRRWRFGGGVGPDECVRVGTLDLEIPETLGGLTIDLSLTADGVSTTNHYATAVTVTPD